MRLRHDTFRVAMVGAASATGTSGRFADLLRRALDGAPPEVVTAAATPAALTAARADAVVLAGAEPTTSRLSDEPVLAAVETTLDWAMERGVPVLVSCLAAHAALLTLDGVDRCRLERKCSGVYAHDVGTSSLVAGIAGPVPLPHSRWHAVPGADIADAGWTVIFDSPVGWGAATATRGTSVLLALQGHPEYGGGTLLREWRRDLLRFCAGETPVAPVAPVAAVADTDAPMVAALDAEVRAGRTGAVADFPFEDVAGRAPSPWRPAAVALCRAWLASAGCTATPSVAHAG